jgi:hypothetical protein
MATTDDNGILFYEDTDAVSPLDTMLNAGQQSISDAFSAAARIFPVANTGERDALTAGSTVDNPRYIDFTGVLWSCNDETNWRRVADFARYSTTEVANGSGIFTATWPTGRFTQAPLVHATVYGGTFGVASILTRTTSGCTGAVYYYSGSAWAIGSGFTVQLTATQALSASALG